MPSSDQAGSSLNGSGTDSKSDTPLTQAGSGFDLPEPVLNLMKETRAALTVTMRKYGPTSAIGHRCSNIMQLMKAGASPAAIAKQMIELDHLLNAR